jgi:hypothetical protein
MYNHILQIIAHPASYGVSHHIDEDGYVYINSKYFRLINSRYRKEVIGPLVCSGHLLVKKSRAGNEMYISQNYAKDNNSTNYKNGCPKGYKLLIDVDDKIDHLLKNKLKDVNKRIYGRSEDKLRNKYPLWSDFQDQLKFSKDAPIIKEIDSNYHLKNIFKQTNPNDRLYNSTIMMGKDSRIWLDYNGEAVIDFDIKNAFFTFLLGVLLNGNIMDYISDKSFQSKHLTQLNKLIDKHRNELTCLYNMCLNGKFYTIFDRLKNDFNRYYVEFTNNNTGYNIKDDVEIEEFKEINTKIMAFIVAFSSNR